VLRKSEITVLVALLSVSVLLIQFMDADTRTVSFEGVEDDLTVEVADNFLQRSKGLMYREELGYVDGMIFKYDEEKERVFWMKNTYIPLDIIFIDSEKQIVNIEEAEPEPNTSRSDLELYRSERASKYVLEVEKGFSEKNNLTEGDRMVFRDKGLY